MKEKDKKVKKNVTINGLIQATIVLIAWVILTILLFLIYLDPSAPIVSGVIIFAFYMILPKRNNVEKVEAPLNEVVKEDIQSERTPADEQILQIIDIVQDTYSSFGISTKVVEVEIREKYYNLYLRIAMGTKVDDIISLSKDIALALASPTGKVDIHMVPGRDTIEMTVPRGKKFAPKGKYKIIEVVRESVLKSGNQKTSEFYHDLKMFVRVILLKIGDLFYWLETKVPRKPLY